MTKPRFLNPKTIAPPPGNGYTHVVEATGRTIYVAGQLGLDIDGNLAGGPGDFRAQAKQAFENLRAALEAVGAGFGDVVKVNNYLTDIRQLPLLRNLRAEYLNIQAPPASTTVAVTALAREGAVFEIDAVAVLPD